MSGLLREKILLYLCIRNKKFNDQTNTCFLYCQNMDFYKQTKNCNNVQLSDFNGADFNKGAGLIKRILWYYINALCVRSTIIPFMRFKISLLRLFGAKIGKGVYLKPSVNIKFPWKLIIGNNCWIGEGVWIDNIDNVSIGNNVCLSQGALLLTGNHDYKKTSMPYKNSPIVIKDGAWIGAKSVVCSGVTIEENAILTVGSIATRNLEKNGIYQGNPAQRIRDRVFNE